MNDMGTSLVFPEMQVRHSHGYSCSKSLLHILSCVSGSFIVVCVRDVGLHSGGKGLAHTNRADGLSIHRSAGSVASMFTGGQVASVFTGIIIILLMCNHISPHIIHIIIGVGTGGPGGPMPRGGAWPSQ